VNRSVTQVQTVAQACDILEVARPGDVIVYFVDSTVKSLNGLRAAGAMRVTAAPLFALFGKLQSICGRNQIRHNDTGQAEHIFIVTGLVPSKTLAQARKVLDGTKS